MAMGIGIGLSLAFVQSQPGVSPITVTANVGAKTRAGLGGLLTTEAASSALTGTNHGDFVIDDASTLVPAGTYNTAWSPVGSTWSLTGASGKVYAITKVATAADLAVRSGTPSHNDTGNGAPDLTQMYLLFRVSTASGGLALGDTAYWRDCAYNPTNALWYFEPLPVASFTGSGRITIRSDNPDSSIDANGNANRKHGAKMGLIYFNGDSTAGNYPFDYRDIWFYTDAPVPVTVAFFQYALSAQGVGFYNCRVECGPSVLSPSDQQGIKTQGDAVIDGCYFKNLGTLATSLNTKTVTGTASLTNSVFDSIITDALEFNGSNITISGNLGFGWQFHAGDHQDPIQYTGDGTFVGGSGYVNGTYTNVPLTGGTVAGVQATIVVSGGAVSAVTITDEGTVFPQSTALSASNTNLGGSGSGFVYTSSGPSPTGWLIEKNFYGNDTGGNLQSGIYISDQFGPGFTPAGPYRLNCIHMGNVHGITLDRPNAPVITANNVLCDPYGPGASTTDSGINLRAQGTGGATITNNVCNAISVGTQPGSITNSENVVIARSSKTLLQYITALQLAFPNLPANQSDNRWKSRAGWLNIWTPANLAVASGGVVQVSGRVSGMLFPAVPGQTIGAWNDLSVYDPLNPTWVAAHPPAT